MRESNADVLQGTLDLLVLKALSLQPMHGWGISQRILQISEQTFSVGQGSLYPALYRLEKRSLVKSEWGTSENNREAKFYTLTTAGKRALGEETKSWRDFAKTMEIVLESKG
ncbi:MAG: PadR family transcriptional regulator [Gemmatimonas sp.]